MIEKKVSLLNSGTLIDSVYRVRKDSILPIEKLMEFWFNKIFSL